MFLRNCRFLILLARMIFVGAFFGPVYVVAQSSQDCRSLFEKSGIRFFNELSSRDQRERFTRAQQPDLPTSKTPENRVKILTDGDPKRLINPTVPSAPFIDTSDPSMPFSYTWPDGSKEVRIWLSDGLYLSYPDIAAYERGGIAQVSRVRSFNNNGIEMTGSASTTPYPWDTELYLLPDGGMVGHGGAVLVSSPTDRPTNEENPRRSRMWAKVVREKLADGSIDERWYYQKSLLHDENPINNEWIQPWHHHHSYGGTMLKDQNGIPVQNDKGNFIYYFDMVDQQKKEFPWRTSIYVSEMNPSTRKLVGPKQLVHNGINPHTRKPYPATVRSFGGSLIEGFRPFLQATYVSPGLVRDSAGKVIALDDAELGGMASPGDYTDHYGFAMLYKPRGKSILGRYEMVENSDSSDIEDFAGYYRNYFGLTWIGRASPYYNAQLGAWRISFHAVPLIQGIALDAREHYRLVMWSPIQITRNSKGQLTMAPFVPDQK